MLISFKGRGFLWKEQAAHGSTRGRCLLTGDNYGKLFRVLTVWTSPYLFPIGED